MPWMTAFHTSQPEVPKVFHDNSDCPLGQKIAPKHRRMGVGDMRFRCHLCADLKDKDRAQNDAQAEAGTTSLSG